MTYPTEPLELTSRQVAVARAYVTGLEGDRELLHKLEQKYSQTIWEVVQLGAYNRAASRALQRLVLMYSSGVADADILDRVEDLLVRNEEFAQAIWICACGHSKYDHDEHGCQYLGCAPICGVS